MKKYSFELNNREVSPYNLHDGFSKVTRASSKGSLSSIGLPPKMRHHKSPSTTPTGSPMLPKPNFEDLSNSFSDLKDSPTKDQLYYLKQKILIQEKRIQLLEEENKRLNSTRKGDYWEKELIKRNDEVRKLENQLKYFMGLNQPCAEEHSFDLIVEKDRKISELEEDLMESKLKIKSLESLLKEAQNQHLQKVKESSQFLKKEECEILMNQIQELEISLEYQAEVNKQLKEENLILTRETQTGSLTYFSQDIHKIRREMGKLTSLMQDFVQGKEITLKSLLGLGPDPKSEPLKQISMDIQSIKSDLNVVLGLISDIHAEQFANVVCRNQ
jgi:hypothetical protein